MPDTRDATAERKDSHIRICLDEQVEFVSLGSRGDGNGFGSYRFDHDALPEVSKSEVSLATTVLGKRLKAPLFIGAMTGGTERAAEINRRLAVAAERCGVGMALGSQRKMIEKPDLRSSYAVREHAPGVPI